ncbi:hypothetical protein EON80_26460, partial [bacterium]
MKSPEKPTPTPSFQKLIPNTLLFYLGIPLVLFWLMPLAAPVRWAYFWASVFDADLPAAWTSFALLALLLALWKPLRVGQWSLPPVAEAAQWLDRNIWRATLATLPFFALIGYFVSHRHALSMDEYNVVFQSYAFAAGHLTGQVPPGLIDAVVPAEYQGHFLHVSHAKGTIMSAYWPGYALLLTPFSFFGVPWLCNPVITTFTVGAVHRATARMTGSLEAAFWAALFALASPVIAINSATYFSMPAHLMGNVLYCWLLASGTRRTAFIAGLVGSWALLLHNPVPHAMFALPWLAWMALKRRDLLFPVLLGYLLVAVPLGLKWMSFWNGFDLRPEVKALKASATPRSSMDTLTRILTFFTPPSLDLLLARFAALCKTVSWAAPGLAVLALAGAKTSKKERYTRLLKASFVLTFCFYLFVPFLQGLGWG